MVQNSKEKEEANIELLIINFFFNQKANLKLWAEDKQMFVFSCSFLFIPHAKLVLSGYFWKLKIITRNFELENMLIMIDVASDYLRVSFGCLVEYFQHHQQFEYSSKTN